MKTLISAILIGCLLPIMAFYAGDKKSKPLKNSQQWKSGYVISNDGDTMKGGMRIAMTLAYDNYISLEFVNSDNNKMTLSPRQIKGYCYYDTVRNQVQTTVFVSLPNTLFPIDTTIQKRKNYFFRLVQDGKCKVYGFRGIYDPSGLFLTAVGGAIGGAISDGVNGVPVGGANVSEGLCIQSGNSDLWILKQNGFKKEMCEFFRACPHLVDKIKAKIYTPENWQSMIQDYNNYGCL